MDRRPIWTTTSVSRTRPPPPRMPGRYPRTSTPRPRRASSGVGGCRGPGRVVSGGGDCDGSGWPSPRGCCCWYRRAVAAWPDPGARLQRPPRRSRPSSSRMRGTRRLGPLCRLLHPRLPPYCLPPRPETQIKPRAAFTPTPLFLPVLNLSLSSNRRSLRRALAFRRSRSVPLDPLRVAQRSIEGRKEGRKDRRRKPVVSFPSAHRFVHATKKRRDEEAGRERSFVTTVDERRSGIVRAMLATRDGGRRPPSTEARPVTVPVNHD